jgi:hypothetical protein
VISSNTILAAELPFELISLVMSPPSPDAVTEEESDKFMDETRGYLYSWLLVYEAFAASSIRVRGDYNTHLKTDNCVTPLLDFISVHLGLVEGKPMDINKKNIASSDIRKYDVLNAEDSMETMEMMMINLYYSALKYTPNLVNNWRLQCNSRQTVLAVEQWTEKNFSPLIVHDTLQDVIRWSQNQESTDDEKDLEIKTSTRTGEVTAGYEVDDMMAQIRIEIPLKYPFENVKVIGVNRVAAKTEQVWNGWIMAIQGVIQFSVSDIPLLLCSYQCLANKATEWVNHRRSDCFPKEHRQSVRWPS